MFIVVLLNLCLQFHKAEDAESLKAAIELYQDTLRNRTNPKNLKLFVNAFLK